MYEEIFDTGETENEDELLAFDREGGELETETDGGYGESQEEREIQLAAELLSVADEAELDQFLGKFLRGVAKTPGGRKLKDLLRATAGKALPLGGQAIGGYFGGQRGATFGGQVGAAASQLFGLETEGMSPEDRELQIARRFVRLAGDAAKRLGGITGIDPMRAARTALLAAAQRHAPGLASRLRGGLSIVNQTNRRMSMHDLDRTLRSQESESDYESDEIFLESESDYEQESGEITEQEEIDLASELLTVTSEQELDQFLGGVFKKLKGKIVPALKTYIKPLAKKLIPIAARAAGGFFGGPAGAAIGGKIGNFATTLFEVDFESMDPESQDFEVARNFVRFASAAAKNAAAAPAAADPRQVARTAIVRAARTHAPGLLRNRGASPGGSVSIEGGGRCRQGGRWYRNRAGDVVIKGL